MYTNLYSYQETVIYKLKNSHLNSILFHNNLERFYFNKKNKNKMY